jgi:ATP-dependent RNA circularization protein (DNA/RNA ligase family)
MEQKDMEGFPRMRRSACAESSLRAEIERVKKMTVEERMSAALNMGKVLSGLQGKVKPEEVYGRK